MKASVRTRALFLPFACLTASLAPAAIAQDNPVFVDDSPVAWELFQRAGEQAAPGGNLTEAVRLYQELLDDFPLRLIPDRSHVRHAAEDRLVTVRRRVLDAIASDPDLLARYRALETTEAARLLEAGELDRLAISRPLTEPGLDAMLTLGQRELENGRFRAAVRWLEPTVTHPDLGPARLARNHNRGAHAWFMLGAAWHYLGGLSGAARAEEASRLVEAIDALNIIGSPVAEQLAERLTEMMREDEWPQIERGLTLHDRTSVGDLTDVVAERIWTVSLPDSLASRRDAERAGRPPMARPLRPATLDGALMAAVPTVAGNVVYVNQGHVVSAIDRFTGSPVWPPYVDRPTVALIEREDEHARDMNLVVVHGNALVTLTGHAHSTSRSGDGRVLCLDARTGRLRWVRRLDRIGERGADSVPEEHEGLFPKGAPIIADGTVYLLARKVSPQALTSVYAVALDLDTGDLRWIQHIVSSGSIRRAARAYSDPLYEGGELFIATPVGGMARLDAVTGEVRWLTRFRVPILPTAQEQDRRPWEISRPVLVSRRDLNAVVAVQPGQRRVVVLDAESGQLIESHDAAAPDGWNSPSYLLAEGARVYAVGRDIRAFDADAMERPLWILSESQGGVPESVPVDIHGRVQLVDGMLIVPSVHEMVIVDAHSGDVLHRVALEEPGNPVAVGDQVLLAGDRSLDAYMALRRAEAMLRERIAARPSDPGAAMALLRLARRAGDVPLALDAAEHALIAIDAGSLDARLRHMRNELFATLLAVAEDHTGRGSSITQSVDPLVAEAAFALLGRIATTTEQRLGHLLALADWLVDHDAAAAMDTWQQVLSDRDLAAVQRTEHGMTRPARAWVVKRLAALIESRGRGLYAAHARRAEERLGALLAAERVDPHELLVLADEYPCAEASVDAALEAAERFMQRGRHNDALAAVMRSFRPLPRCSREGGRLDDAAVARLFEMYGRVRAEAGWAGHAGSMGADPSVEDVPREFRRARIGEQSGEADLLFGRLVPLHERAADRPLPPDRALLIDEERVALVVADSAGSAQDRLETKWSVPIGSDRVELLLMDERRIVVWIEDGESQAGAVMLDASDGGVVWSTPRFTLDAGTRRHGERVIRGSRRGSPPEPAAPALTPLTDGRMLLVVGSSGRVEGFDLDDGSAARWSSSVALDEVRLSEMRDGLLALCGLRRASGGAVVVIDTRTGQSTHEQAAIDVGGSGAAVPDWMAFMPMGVLLLGGDGSIEAIDLHTAERLWAQNDPSADFQVVSTRATFANQAIEFDAQRLLVEQRGVLRWLDAERGLTGETFEPVYDAIVARDSRDVQPLDGAGRTHITDLGVMWLTPNRVVSYALDGSIMGADALRTDGTHRWLLPAANRHVLVTELPPTHEMSGPQRRLLRMNHLHILSEDCRLLAPPVELPPLPERLADARLIDGWVLLSTGGQTLAVPYPVSEPALHEAQMNVQ